MAKHFFTPEYPTVAGAYWLRRKADKRPTLVRVGIAPSGDAVARDLDRQCAGAIDNGDFEGDWLGPIEPKEGIPLGFLTAGMNCTDWSLGFCHHPSYPAALIPRPCPADNVPDYCPLRGE